MKVFKPLRDNVIVEKAETDSPILGADRGTWIRLKVIAVGPEVIEKIKPGQIVLAEAMLEEIKGSKIFVMLSKYIHVIEESDAKYES